MSMALVVGVAAYLGYRKAVQFMEQYAQKEPLDLPAVHYSPAELKALQKRVDVFLKQASAPRTNARLELSADDINALVASSGFSNRVYVTLASNTITGRFSVPFEEIGMPLFSGRYLNGAGTLDVGCQGGVLAISLQHVTVNGVPLPDHYMSWLEKQNFARNIATNAATKVALQGVGRIGVVNESLILEVEPDPVSQRL